MTAHKKLGALIVGAFLVLALGSGAALAGQGHNKKHKSEPGYSYYSQTRYVSTSNGAYKHGKSYGKRARNDYAWNGNDSRRANAYGKRGRNNYVYGNDHRGGASRSYRQRTYWNDGHASHRHSSSRTVYNGGDGHASHRHSASQTVYDVDNGYTKRSKSVGIFQTGHGDDQQLVRLSSGKVVRVKLPKNFDRSSITCYEKKHTGTDNGRRARISKTVCKDANGKTFAVAGSRQVIKYLD